MPTALLNGVHIHYESYGQGFPLVFAYGLGGNTTEWAGQIPAFSKKYRFIVWDPRGHGQSDSPPNLDQYGSGNSAYDLLALMDHLGIRRAYVGGLSMGGGISTRFALHFPTAPPPSSSLTPHPHRVCQPLRPPCECVTTSSNSPFRRGWTPSPTTPFGTTPTSAAPPTQARKANVPSARCTPPSTRWGTPTAPSPPSTPNSTLTCYQPSARRRLCFPATKTPPWRPASSSTAR